MMADLNDLQNDWDSQPTYSEEKMNEIATLVQSRSDSMRNTLFKRDMGETAAAIFIVACFAPALFFVSGTIAKVGIFIAIFGAIEIAILMNWVRSLDKADFAALPLKDFLASELRSMDRQIALLRYVAWWYLLPLYTGASLFVFGIDWASADTPKSLKDFIFSICFASGYFVFCVFIWRLNQGARKTQLQPLRDVLQRTYDSVTALESPEAESDLLTSLADPKLNIRKTPEKTSYKLFWVLFGTFLSLGIVIFAIAALIEFYGVAPQIAQQFSQFENGGKAAASAPATHFRDATSVDDLAIPLIEQNELKALSVGIVSFDADGNLQSETHHYGIVDYRDDNGNPPRPPSDDTLYEIGGLSKVFTGILLATAVEREEVTLDSPLSEFVPPNVEIPSFNGHGISLLDMITDRSGLPRLPNNLPVTTLKDPYQNYTADMAEEFLTNYQLKAAPGSRHLYSNFAAAYLGYVLTKIAGEESYDTLLSDRVSVPLGLQHTRVALDDEPRQLPVGHNRWNAPTPAWHFGNLPGNGGIRSSIADMNRLMTACIQPQENDIGNAVQLTLKRHGSTNTMDLGLGWIAITDEPTRWVNGSTGGFRGAMFVNRPQGVGVCVLSNSSKSVVDAVAKKIYEMNTPEAEFDFAE